MRAPPTAINIGPPDSLIPDGITVPFVVRTRLRRTRTNRSVSRPRSSTDGSLVAASGGAFVRRRLAQ